LENIELARQKQNSWSVLFVIYDKIEVYFTLMAKKFWVTISTAQELGSIIPHDGEIECFVHRINGHWLEWRSNK